MFSSLPNGGHPYPPMLLSLWMSSVPSQDIKLASKWMQHVAEEREKASDGFASTNTEMPGSMRDLAKEIRLGFDSRHSQEEVMALQRAAMHLLCHACNMLDSNQIADRRSQIADADRQRFKRCSGS